MQEIGDIVAFLKTLKTPRSSATEVDDPNKRPPPVETRDNLDDLVNPGLWTVETAQQLWTTRRPGRVFLCELSRPREDHFKTWAAGMPKWEPRLDKVLGVEEFVYRHAQAATGLSWLMQSSENTRHVGLPALPR